MKKFLFLFFAATALTFFVPVVHAEKVELKAVIELPVTAQFDINTFEQTVQVEESVVVQKTDFEVFVLPVKLTRQREYKSKSVPERITFYTITNSKISLPIIYSSCREIQYSNTANPINIRWLKPQGFRHFNPPSKA